MQSFLNVITPQTYTFFTMLPQLHGRSKRFFRDSLWPLENRCCKSGTRKSARISWCEVRRVRSMRNNFRSCCQSQNWTWAARWGGALSWLKSTAAAFLGRFSRNAGRNFACNTSSCLTHKRIWTSLSTFQPVPMYKDIRFWNKTILKPMSFVWWTPCDLLTAMTTCKSKFHHVLAHLQWGGGAWFSKQKGQLNICTS
jgi:hypothetical protein